MPEHRGKTVRQILRSKKGSIKNAPLAPGSPDWAEILDDTWEEVVRRARQREIGYQTIKKLLSDPEYNK